MMVSSEDGGRRAALGRVGLALAAPFLPLSPLVERASAAEAGQVTKVEDVDRGYSFEYPAGWIKGTAEFPGASKNPARPTIASFVSPDNKDVNVAVVSYAIQPDYSKLGSLGTIEDVAGTLIGRSGNLDAEMFSQKEKKIGGVPAYTFDYRIGERRLKTVFAIEAGQFYGNWLVTITVQAPQKDYTGDNAAALDAVIQSFTLTPR